MGSLFSASSSTSLPSGRHSHSGTFAGSFGTRPNEFIFDRADKLISWSRSCEDVDDNDVLLSREVTLSGASSDESRSDDLRPWPKALGDKLAPSSAENETRPVDRLR